MTTVDELLKDLVEAVDANEMVVPIVLHTETITVRGDLVSESTFYEALGKHIGKHATEVPRVKEWAENFSNRSRAASSAFVYVRNARIFGHGEPLLVLCWRARITDVKSFSVPPEKQTIQPPVSSVQTY